MHGSLHRFQPVVQNPHRLSHVTVVDQSALENSSDSFRVAEHVQPNHVVVAELLIKIIAKLKVQHIFLLVFLLGCKLLHTGLFKKYLKLILISFFMQVAQVFVNLTHPLLYDVIDAKSLLCEL